MGMTELRARAPPSRRYQALGSIPFRAGRLPRPDIPCIGTFPIAGQGLRRRTSGYPPGPTTVNSNPLESFLPSRVQMAPWSSQSSVTGRTMLTFPSASGRTVIRQWMSLELSTRRAFFTVPPVTWSAWTFRVRKLRGNSSLNRISNVNTSVPLCVAGLFSKLTVSGRRAAATMPVAALVSVSPWPASSVKDTRTLIVLPSSAAIRV